MALLTEFNSGTARFYTVNQTTGALTQVGSNHALAAGVGRARGLAVVGSTVYALILEDTGNTASFYTVNTSTEHLPR